MSAENKQTEDALRQSVAHLRAVLDNVGDGIITIDEGGLIESFNHAAEHIFCYTESEVKGKNVNILMPEPYHGEHDGHMANYVRTGEARILGIDREVIGKRKDGSLFPLEIRVGKVPLIDRTLFTGVVRDVSKQREAQAELAEFKATVDQTLDCVFMFDADSLQFFYINQGAIKQVGYSHDELMRMTPLDIKPDFDEPRFRSLLAPLQGDSESSLTFETIHRHKDGHDIHVEIFLQYIARENSAGHFIAIVRDIDVRKKNEKSFRKRTKQKIHEQEELLRAIIDTAVDGIITISDHGVIETCNQAAENIFGYSADEMIDKNVSILMPEPYAAEHDSYLANYLRSGDARVIGIGREAVGKRKDGSTFPVDLAVAEVRLGNRRIFTGIIRDITERKQTEEDLVLSKEEAERANHHKSEFLSRMSHELRTPLNAIIGFAQLLELEEQDPVKRESVGYILKGGRHLTDLINEVLDIARIESGKQELSPEPVHVRSVLEDSWNLIRPLGDERNILLKGDIPEECDAYIIADLQRLKQVLLNLLSNAIKYNHDGGTVSLSCNETNEGIIHIAISDTGPGISQENRKRIFEPFERINAEGSSIEGTGVGLALSKALIETMGGKLDFDSVPGVGSTFWIELPSIEKPTEQIHTDVKELPHVVIERPGEGANKPVTLLYIEDNISNFRLVEVALSRRPHVKLIPAMQGKLGIDLALNHNPDMIMLDLHLPDLPGSEVLGQLKSHPDTRDIPVVVISADATMRQINKLLTSGAQEYLTKPFNLKKLLRILDDLAAGS